MALATAALGATSFPEQNSLASKVLGQCRAEVAGLVDFAGVRPLVLDEQADAALVDYFNHLFFKGWGANKGGQILAGRLCLVPGLLVGWQPPAPPGFPLPERLAAPGACSQSAQLAPWLCGQG